MTAPIPPKPRPDNRPRPANPPGPKGPPRQEDATSARIREYVDRIVAEAPPLTPDQKARLAVLLATPERRARAA